MNAEGAARIARIARESGIEKFIHVSHLNATYEPEAHTMKGGSRFLKSKVYL